MDARRAQRPTPTARGWQRSSIPLPTRCAWSTGLLAPVMPESTAKIWRQLGLTSDLSTLSLDEIAAYRARRRREDRQSRAGVSRASAKRRPSQKLQQIEEQSAPRSETSKLFDAAPGPRPLTAAAAAARAKLPIDDFLKWELRVGEVLVAERVKGASKLLRLEVDIGSEVRQILAGIAEHYAPEALVGRKVVILANLEPRKLRGLESNGMLLAASVGKEDRPVIVTFTEDVPNGARLPLMFADSHAHLDFPDFDADREQVFERARAAGVEYMMAMGGAGGPAHLRSGIEIAEGPRHTSGLLRAFIPMMRSRPPKNTSPSWPASQRIRASPPSARSASIITTTILRARRSSASSCARWRSPPRLACHRHPLPRSLGRLPAPPGRALEAHRPRRHSALLQRHNRRCPARHGMGFYVSFAGNLTFPKAGNLRDVAAQIPRDHLLIETDCPFLAPVPKRGKRNEPSYVVHTAAQLAALHNCPVEEVGAFTTRNFLGVW